MLFWIALVFDTIAANFYVLSIFIIVCLFHWPIDTQYDRNRLWVIDT